MFVTEYWSLVTGHCLPDHGRLSGFRPQSGYDLKVKVSRFLLIVLYMGYLVNAGLLLILLPWSKVWGLILTEFPPVASAVLDTPWIRGVLSAFGVLHLMLVLWELVHPTLLVQTIETKTESQNNNQS